MEEPFLEYPRVETLEQLCIEFSEPRCLPGGDPTLEHAPAAFFHHCSEVKDNYTVEREVAGSGAQHNPSDDQDTNSQKRWRGAPVARRRADELSYDEFLRSFMAANVPLVIEGVTETWPAMRDLVQPDGGVDLSRLASDFGGAEVPVTTMPDHPDGDCLCQNMRVEEFARWWQDRDGAGVEAGSLLSGDSSGARSPMQGAGLKYLKDWHFVNEFGDSYTAYKLPKYFREDWLNEYFDSQQLGKEGTSDGGDIKSETAASDYRFVYCGPKGTWTPIHADVLRSFSWSANVAGRKRWLLLPPEQTHLLYDRFRHRMAATFRAEELDSLLSPENSFPLLESAAEHVTEVIQCPGEAIFVPSGWHHMVENLDDCLSINHNWFNAWNIHWVVAFILSGHREATDAIEDCRDICSCADEFEDLVQRNLAANCGLDFHGLAKLLSTIADRLSHHADASGTFQEGMNSDSSALLSSKIEQMQVCHALEALLRHWPSSPRSQPSSTASNAEGDVSVVCDILLSSRQDSVPSSTFLLPETHRLAAATLQFLRK